MAHYQTQPPPHQNQYTNNMHNLPPLQPPRHYSPSPYQQSPGGMSPNGIPPNKRQRMSPNPQSPYVHSPYAPTSPYVASPPAQQYLSLPGTPTGVQTPHGFHQPQPYPSHPNYNNMHVRPQQQTSMPPPKVPASKAQDNAELEKADPRGADINQISDVLSGAGIDLRAEEDNLLSTYRQQQTSTSQTSSTASPNTSFTWGQGPLPGMFQGTGPLSHTVTPQDMENELKQKHMRAARALSEAQQWHMNDPFLQAQQMRSKLAQATNATGVNLDVNGLFDKVSENTPKNVTATVLTGANGQQIASLQADSLLNRDAPLVDVLTLISLAAQERLRSVLEDAYALTRLRQVTAEGVVPPEWADIAVGEGNAKTVTVIPTNVSQTTWESPAPKRAASPTAVDGEKGSQASPVDSAPATAGKAPVTASKAPATGTAGKTPATGGKAPPLPKPQTDIPQTPQPTIQFEKNVIIESLKRRSGGDLKYEESRLAKRQKRARANTAGAVDSTPTTPIVAMPEKLTKKERDRLAKIGQSEDVLHRKANETASMALGGKKKYSWMTGGGTPARPGASTPGRLNTAVGGTGGLSGGPAAPVPDNGLGAKEKQLGVFRESGPGGKHIQLRDVLLVLEGDDKEKMTTVRNFVAGRLQKLGPPPPVTPASGH